jgi:hypothetical protein
LLELFTATNRNSVIRKDFLSELLILGTYDAELSLYLTATVLQSCQEISCILIRQQELNIQQHETLTDLEDFAENSHSSILYVLLNVFGATDEEISYAASHVGVCSGIVTQLRGMAQLASQVHNRIRLVNSPSAY